MPLSFKQIVLYFDNSQSTFLNNAYHGWQKQPFFPREFNILKVLVILPKISYILVILLLLLRFSFIFYYIIFYLYYSVQSPFENCLLFVIIVFFHTSDEVISIDDGTFSWAENQPAILKKWVLVLFKIEFGISSSSGMMLCRAAPIKLVDGQWTFDD